MEALRKKYPYLNSTYSYDYFCTIVLNYNLVK